MGRRLTPVCTTQDVESSRLASVCTTQDVGSSRLAPVWRTQDVGSSRLTPVGTNEQSMGRRLASVCMNEQSGAVFADLSRPTDLSRPRPTSPPQPPSPTPHCFAMLRGEGGAQKELLFSLPLSTSGVAAKLERGLGGEVGQSPGLTSSPATSLPSATPSRAFHRMPPPFRESLLPRRHAIPPHNRLLPIAKALRPSLVRST